ncbi:ribonuclease H-like domain-containing protein [Tanacetum coccineum]
MKSKLILIWYKVLYRGVAKVVTGTAWICNLFRELHTPYYCLLHLFVVTMSVHMDPKSVQHQRAKHIEIDIHRIRDTVSQGQGQVRVLNVTSCYQYVDIFIKGLPSTLFEEFHTTMSV